MGPCSDHQLYDPACSPMGPGLPVRLSRGSLAHTVTLLTMVDFSPLALVGVYNSPSSLASIEILEQRWTPAGSSDGVQDGRYFIGDAPECTPPCSWSGIQDGVGRLGTTVIYSPSTGQWRSPVGSPTC